MKVQPTLVGAILFAAALASTSCDAVDRARTRFGNTTTDTIVTASGSGVTLGLQVPPTLNPGDQGVVRIALTNTTDTAISNVRVELILPGWAEPMPPEIGDRPVSMSALGDGSTSFAYRMDEAPLAPKQSQTVEQRIRVPASGSAKQGVGAWTRIVRARLLTPDNRPLAQVETQIVIDSSAIAASHTAAAQNAPWRDQLGGLQLGMTAAAAKQAQPNGRDTAWSREGMRHRGMLVPVSGGTALVILSQDTVARIEVGDPSIRTAERLGVGSTMEQLRAAYGSPCADASAGRVVVWFARAPGITFVTNSPVPQIHTEVRDNPGQIPNTAQVTRWWLSRDVETCSNY
jgi:hypothetical protein